MAAGESKRNAGKENYDVSFRRAVDGFSITEPTPFLPAMEMRFAEDNEEVAVGTMTGYAVTWNQAYIFNRTSSGQLDDIGVDDEGADGICKIGNMGGENVEALDISHEREYFVEVIIDKDNFLITKAVFTGVESSDAGNIKTYFPHILFPTDEDVGPFTGYYPVARLIDGDLAEYTQRSNIQLSDRQFKQLGPEAGGDPPSNAAWVLVETGHKEDTEPVRVRGIQGTGDITVIELAEVIVISGETGWSGANCCDYNAGTCGVGVSDADWWAYVDGTLMPSKFRGLSAGTGVYFDALNEDGCITEISVDTGCCTGTDAYELKTYVYHKDDHPSHFGYPPSTTSTFTVVTNDKSSFTITDGNVVIGEQGTYCASAVVYGSLTSKGWDANTHGSLSSYDKDDDKNINLDSDPDTDNYISSAGPLGIGTTQPVAGRSATVEGTLKVQGAGSEKPDGKLEFGESTTNPPAINYSAGDGMVKAFDDITVVIANKGGYVVGSSPATGSAILGGSGSAISGHYNVIVGGATQLISGTQMNFIGGGSGIDILNSEFSVSVGGRNNDITGSNFAVIGGGYNNLIDDSQYGFIGGGALNEVQQGSDGGGIIGGYGNRIKPLSTYSILGGGRGNTLSGRYNVMVGGLQNTVSGWYSASLGGNHSVISGDNSAILGGEYNYVSGNAAVAMGNYSNVQQGHDGAFVFSDSVITPVYSTGADTMVLKFKSGVFIDGDSGLYINSANGIHINGNPVMTGVSDTDVDTLQSVTTRGDTTTTNIVSENIVSGASGFFDIIATQEGNLKLGPAGSRIALYDNEGNAKGIYGANVGLGYQTNAVSATHVYLGAGIDSPDVKLTRDDAANVLALRNTTAAQQFNIYNTYTSATNYERAALRWDDDVFSIGTETGSAGGDVRSLDFRVSGQSALYIDSGTQNVGIGTNAPSQKLQIGDGNDADYMLIDAYSAGYGEKMFEIKDRTYPNFYVLSKASLAGEVFAGTYNFVGNTKFQITDTAADFTDPAGSMSSFNVGDGSYAATMAFNSRGKNADAFVFNRAVDAADADLFQIREYDVARLVVNDSGRVGIGLSNPLHRLHVSGSVAGTGVAGRITLNGTGYLLSGDSPAETQTLQDVCNNGSTTTTSISGVSGLFNDIIVSEGGIIRGPNAEDRSYAQFNPWSTDFRYDDKSILQLSNGIVINNNAFDMDVQIHAVTANALFIEGSSANVGLGTSAPSDKLEVYASGANVALRIHEDAGTHEAKLHLRRGGNDWEIINNSDLAIEIEDTEVFRIDTDGNVGIGTADPQYYKLHLNDDDTSTLAIQCNGNNATGSKIRLIEGSANFLGAYMHYDGSTNKFNLGVHDTSNSTLADDTAAITIDRTTAFVGIGSTSPTVELDVASTDFDGSMKWTHDSLFLHNTGDKNQIIVGCKANSPTGSYFRLTEGPNTVYQGGYIQYDGLLNNLNIGVNDGGTAFTHDVTAITIERETAYVGIGSASPAAQLDVIGTGLFSDAVGIGTDDPTEALEVDGNIKIGYDKSIIGYGGTEHIRFYDPSDQIILSAADSIRFDTKLRINGNQTVVNNAGDYYLQFYSADYDGFAQSLRVGVPLIVDAGQTALSSRTDLEFRIDSNDDSTSSKFFVTRDTGEATVDELFTIVEDGKVGIGTNAPATELYVKRASSAGGANADTIFQVENDDHANIVISTPSAKVGRFGFGDASNSLKGFTAYDHGSDQMTFQVNSATAMTINSAGNVGIGSAPTNKLDVFGHFTATTKSFLIDHPTKENKKLQYASLEGPEHAVYVRGTHDGSLIELPEYWSELVHKDSLTVSLTPLGEHQNLYVKYKDATCISVGGVKGSYDYIVYGERKDTDKLEVEPLKV